MTDDTSTADNSALSKIAMPFWHSQVLQGILAAALGQIFAAIKAKYHIDVPSLFGITADSAALWLLNAASAAALFYAAHGRITQKTAPVLTISRTQAAALNASQQPPAAPA
jgi:hypothetical protein